MVEINLRAAQEDAKTRLANSVIDQLEDAILKDPFSYEWESHKAFELNDPIIPIVRAHFDEMRDFRTSLEARMVGERQHYVILVEPAADFVPLW